MSMSDNIIANLSNPIPILSQPSSSTINTNPFIPNEQREIELKVIQKQANNIVEQAYESNKTSSIANLTLKEINTNVSNSFLGLVDDMYQKPDDIPWKVYLPKILEKEQRYAYLGVLLILISLYILLSKRT